MSITAKSSGAEPEAQGEFSSTTAATDQTIGYAPSPSGSSSGPPTGYGTRREQALRVLVSLSTIAGLLKPAIELANNTTGTVVMATLWASTIGFLIWLWWPDRQDRAKRAQAPAAPLPEKRPPVVPRWLWKAALVGASVVAVAWAALLMIRPLLPVVLLPGEGNLALQTEGHCQLTASGGLRLSVTGPRPTGWAESCCFEFRRDVQVPPSSRLWTRLWLQAPDQVEIKLEQGRYGDPDQVGWMIQQQLGAGGRALDRPLVIAPGGQPLKAGMRAARICVALLNPGASPNEVRLERAELR